MMGMKKEEGLLTCEICNGHYFPKNMEAHKTVHARRKAEKEQKRQKRIKKLEKLERIKFEKSRKIEQAKIRRKEKEELREQARIRRKEERKEALNLKIEQEESEIYPCESCGKTYAKQFLLELHIERVHAEPIKCPDCDFKTNYKERLRKHMMQHEGKIYETCPICSKKYIGRTNLRTHMLNRHEKREKTTCPEPSCGKTVLTQCLKRHLKLHSQDQDRHFQCEDCDYKARDKYNLKLHRGKMHEDNPLVKEQCSHCDVQTTSISNHIKAFHPDIYWNFHTQK